ncbi:hypothetical protein [Bacillus andreraoultii]|uniref:hypothetical protein n=1 Tax=Bacillus andreraoultii TaxID=1499685 RepID=UPI00053A3E6B|nr:hypothetical protein [Bacillus andreraoultii]
MKVEVLSKEKVNGRKITKIKIDNFEVTVESNEPSPEAIKEFNKSFLRQVLEGNYSKGVSA